MSDPQFNLPEPADPFRQITAGLVDAAGRPLGTTEVQRNLIQGVVHGFAFLMLEDDKVGVCQMGPDDCWVTDTRLASEPDGPLIQTLMLRVKPGWHQFAEPWDGVPGVAADIIAKLREALERQAEELRRMEEAARSRERVAEQYDAVKDDIGGSASPEEPTP